MITCPYIDPILGKAHRAALGEVVEVSPGEFRKLMKGESLMDVDNGGVPINTGKTVGVFAVRYNKNMDEIVLTCGDEDISFTPNDVFDLEYALTSIHEVVRKAKAGK